MGQFISNNLNNDESYDNLYNEYIKIKSKYDNDRIKLETLQKLNNDLEENVSKITEENLKNNEIESKNNE